MKDLHEGKARPVADDRFTDPDIPKIPDLVGSLLVTLKNHALYPENHITCRKSVIVLQRRLENFLANQDVLHLDVKEDRFLFQDKVVHQGPSQNDYLPFQLFRDGIQWIEFHHGLTENELSAFCKLILHYRIPKEEAEGDLVTALWEAGFPHLRYKNEDVLWQAEPLIDFSSFKTGAEERRSSEKGEKESSDLVPEIAIPVVEPTFWTLTPEEEKTLRDMVYEEEMQDCTEDALEVLAIILQEQVDQKNFAAILDFLAEEFGYALEQCEFHFALKFLESLDALRESLSRGDPWPLALLDDFRQKISSPDVLGTLEQAWPEIYIMESNRRDDLRKVLLWFPADVILTLGPMLANVNLPIIEKFLTEIIGVHAGNNLEQMARLLDSAKEPVIRKLIPVLKNLGGQGSSDLLYDLIRYPSNSICRDAIYTLVAMDPQNLRKIFPLIEDPRPPIRSLVIEYLGTRRNLLAEELLLHYFEENRNRLKDRQHLLACYRALGQCGSARSIPFLLDAILARDWKAFLGVGNSAHRLGAALALMSMPKEKAAKAALEAAARSSFFGIRAAYREAVEERKRKKETGA